MKMIKIFILLFIIITPFKKIFSIDKKSEKNINRTINIDSLNKEETIKLSTNIITFILNLKISSFKKDIFHFYQIAVFDSDQMFEDVQTGMYYDYVRCFLPGTAFAVSKNTPLDYFIVNTYNESIEAYGHHIIYYGKTIIDGKNSELIKRKKNDVIVNISIKDIYYKDNKISLLKSEIKTLYILAFYDKNLNRIIDEDELKKITLIIE